LFESNLRAGVTLGFTVCCGLAVQVNYVWPDFLVGMAAVLVDIYMRL
jgi:hypothetical protein